MRHLISHYCTLLIRFDAAFGMSPELVRLMTSPPSVSSVSSSPRGAAISSVKRISPFSPTSATSHGTISGTGVHVGTSSAMHSPRSNNETSFAGQRLVQPTSSSPQSAASAADDGHEQLWEEAEEEIKHHSEQRGKRAPIPTQRTEPTSSHWRDSDEDNADSSSRDGSSRGIASTGRVSPPHETRRTESDRNTEQKTAQSPDSLHLSDRFYDDDSLQSDGYGE